MIEWKESTNEWVIILCNSTSKQIATQCPAKSELKNCDVLSFISKISIYK